LTQYPSPEGGADTIGWGHKIRPGEDFSKGLTKDQADQLFARDLAPAEKLVQSRVKVPLSQQQYDALVSLAYNLPSAFHPVKSTLLGEINNFDYGGAGDQFMRWNMGGTPKRVMQGLSDRRAGERSIFANGVYSNHE
jgi:lysozyme